MKQNLALKDKKLRKQINGKLNNSGSADENNKYHFSNFFLLKAETQGLRHPVQASLRYFLA
jgi:hypothetical protein